MAERYDAIVVGGGHNGLTTAAYLAKAGLKVIVLERRSVLGGATLTESPVPGYKFSVASYLVSLLRPQVIRELDLAKHGLQMAPSVGTYTPHWDGYLDRRTDHADTLREIRKWSHRDADNYDDFKQTVTDITRFIRPAIDMPAPDPYGDPKEWLEYAGLAKDFGHLPLRTKGALLDLITGSAYDFLRRWFEGEPLIGTMSASGIIGTFLGIKSPGTGMVFLHHYFGEIDGSFREWALPQGGTGAVAAAIASAAQSFGAITRTDAPVKQVLLRGDKAIGVVLESGEEVYGDTIVSAADAKHTFLDMLPAGSLPTDFETAIRNFKFRGSSAKVNFALDGLPTFSAAPPGNGHLMGTVSISPSPDYMERAYDDAKHGHPSKRPFLDMLIPTLVDPSMAPPGKHVATAFVQYAPHKLAPEHGGWDNIKEQFGDLVVDTISEFAPDFRDKIVGRQIMTPLDLERTIGLTEGNIFQGEILVQQMAFNRPVSGWSRYKTPIRDYWLASSSAHPGGGIMAAPGRLAALEILKSKRGEA